MNCTLCQSPTFQQGAFIVAVLLLTLAWGTHLHSLLE